MRRSVAGQIPERKSYLSIFLFFLYLCVYAKRNGCRLGGLLAEFGVMQAEFAGSQ